MKRPGFDITKAVLATAAGALGGLAGYLLLSLKGYDEYFDQLEEKIDKLSDSQKKTLENIFASSTTFEELLSRINPIIQENTELSKVLFMYLFAFLEQIVTELIESSNLKKANGLEGKIKRLRDCNITDFNCIIDGSKPNRIVDYRNELMHCNAMNMQKAMEVYSVLQTIFYKYKYLANQLYARRNIKLLN